MSNVTSITSKSDMFAVPTYHPRQLMLTVVPTAPIGALPEALQPIKTLLELYVMSTRVTATEKGHGHLVGDQQKNYTQEFHFVELRDKVVYNAFRQARDTKLAFSVLMYECSEDRTRIVDAWELAAQIAEVRCSNYPVRNLEMLATPSEAPAIKTTVLLAGTMHHDLGLIQKAQALLDRMTLTGPKPYQQKSFDPMSPAEYIATGGKGIDPDNFL